MAGTSRDDTALRRASVRCPNSSSVAAGSPAAPPGIVLRIDVLEPEGPDRAHLRHVVARPGPVEVGRVAGQNEHRTGRIGLELVSVETVTPADVEDPGDDRVDPIFGVPVWHQLHAARHLHPDRVRSPLGRVSHDDCEAHRGRECRERLPVDVFREGRLEGRLSRLMRSVARAWLLSASAWLHLVLRTRTWSPLGTTPDDSAWPSRGSPFP